MLILTVYEGFSVFLVQAEDAVTDPTSEISNNIGEILKSEQFSILTELPAFFYIFFFPTCAELLSIADPQPDKQEEETLVSYVFLAQIPHCPIKSHH